MLSVIKLSTIMLSANVLSVVMPGVAGLSQSQKIQQLAK